MPHRAWRLCSVQRNFHFLPKICLASQVSLRRDVLFLLPNLVKERNKSETPRHRQANNSELGLEYREYTCDAWVSLSLLKDS
jgi:hypothetical protein